MKNVTWRVSENQAIADANALLTVNQARAMRTRKLGEKPESTYMETYCEAKPMLFSNENDSYLKKAFPKGQKFSALCIASSFDQVIDLALAGAEKIVCVDVNRYQFYVGYIKLLALKYLKHTEFMKFLVDANSPFCMFELMVRYLLKKDENGETTQAVKTFWETLYKKKTAKDIRRECFAGEDKLINDGSQRLVYLNYLKDYNKAKAAITSTKIEFIEADILTDAKKILQDEKVDVVMVSNLHNFVIPEKFIQMLNENVIPVIKPGGKLVNYFVHIPKTWFDAIRRGAESIPVKVNQFNHQHCQQIQTHIWMAHRIYNQFSPKNSVMTVSMPSCRAYSAIFYTDEDSVMITELR